ncbi:dTDP-3-amino-3,6-dideoxy-alpha-D-galactopyranose 3-N-acetyltransferase [Methanobrevibacter oralis]|uniref:dTDP-3-amino-3,6-dideoxy-alpha-D-galactopyranose 3-N-acetyltransferase n=1 Tax=Methanobrevibacter oralis TaxID=66851 RepID=A0A165YVF8_METOA|nr:dTDP-3-amino-3,6-dideoxy-alpha-D-galactopyranose 3-N-acetyltransferase [Methanobrevibacter oralis]
MVRFSSSLEDRQPQNRKKTASQSNENVDYSNYQEMQPQKVIPDDFEVIPQKKPQNSDYSIEEAFKKPISQSSQNIAFPKEDNIKFGVVYSPNSKPPVIGNNYTIRSNSIIYNDVVIGDNFRTGHNVVIRENTNIGDDVLIGTNTVIEGDVIIGNDVSIQSNVYIPTNSVIEDNVFIGPCACFTNDKYPVRINYDLQGPKVRRGASIGGNTTFLSNVEVGEGAIVAAGAIVIHSVPPFYLAIGTPARIKPLPDHLKVPNKF